MKISLKKFTPFIVGAMLLAGCGSTAQHSVSATSAATCHTKVPAQLGECANRLKNTIGPVVPVTIGPAQCADISVWQGVPNMSRLKCVIIQTNDGLFSNRLLGAQIAAAKRAHIPFGFYTFVEGRYYGSEQANFALRLGRGSGETLGYWADAETTGSYERACPYVDTIKAAGVHIYGVYSSPGLWSTRRCAGYVWPAIWGGGLYPLPGYPYSAIKLRQWCGTCSLSGFTGQVDLDENLGLLQLAATHPKPKPKPSRAALTKERLILRGDIRRHHCKTPPKYGGGKYHRLCTRWVKRGGQIVKELK